MKRRISLGSIGVWALLSACGAPAETTGDIAKREDGGWMATPRIHSVQAQGAAFVIRGDAPPDARVVLRGSSGEAYAVGTDSAGKFELRVGLPTQSVLLTPEVQVGQSSVAGPEHLLIVNGPSLAAMLKEGGPSRRLSMGPVLDSIDADGTAVIASGRAIPGSQIQISAGGAPVSGIRAAPDGRWVAQLSTPSGQFASLTVNGRSFDYPGLVAGTGALGVERAGAGWRVTRQLSSSSRQTSWFPDL